MPSASSWEERNTALKTQSKIRATLIDAGFEAKELRQNFDLQKAEQYVKVSKLMKRKIKDIYDSTL